MKLSPPKNLTWLIALVLAVLALLGHLGVIGALATAAFWLALVSAGLLLLASLFKGI